MKFKCTCEEARAERIRQRLLRAALPYCFYMKLLNRPVFEFDSEDDMMRAVMAAEGELMMFAAAAPPRGEGKLTLGAGRSPRMAPPPPRPDGARRPADLAKSPSLQRAKAL